ncbi:MAG: FtsX-like permease family protein, partial [Lachnospiraceae bacterium]|nr:FtsX-like permease family protein [Lachnospiraceae bacterium]
VLEDMISGILIVITVFLTIAIVVAYVSFMRSRVNEYCLYSSIGYSRKAIYYMMMRELGMIFGISMVIGAIISIVAMILLGENLLAYLGLSYKMFYPDQIVKIIAVFAAIVGVLQIPILATLYKIKTIDMIEE